MSKLRISRNSKFLRESNPATTMRHTVLPKLRIASPGAEDKIWRALKTVEKRHFMQKAGEEGTDIGKNANAMVGSKVPTTDIYALTQLFGHGMELDRIQRVLDIGSGSGYFCAISWAIMDLSCKVIGLDRCKDSVVMATHNLNN